MTSNKTFSPVPVPALYSRSSGSSIAARRFVNIVPVRASLAVPQTRGEAGHGTNGSGVRAPASTHRCHLLLTLGEPLERDWLVASPRPLSPEQRLQTLPAPEDEARPRPQWARARRVQSP